MNSKKNHQSTDFYCISGRDDCLRDQQRLHELEVSEQRYQNLFEAVNDAIISISPDGIVMRANQACERVLGWQPGELVGKRLQELLGGFPAVVEAFQRACQGEVRRFEQQLDGLQGQTVCLALRFAPIYDGTDISGVLLVAQDLTEEKLREAERDQLYAALQNSHQALEEKARALEDSQQKLQVALREQQRGFRELREFSRLKSDFLGVASHELRTPLTFLLGALEYLQDSLPDKLSSDEKELLGYAMQGSQRLSDIVENMLDIVRFDAEGFTPQIYPTPLFPLLRQIASDYSAILQERELTLELSPEAEWPELPADSQMLRRALVDVIENAIKYTEDGGLIRVSGRARSPSSLDRDLPQIRLFWPEFPRAEDWQGDYFEIEIKDNGIGIPEQELAHVFERFYTVGNLEEHSSGSGFQGRGAGLGLALVKRILRGHAGLVWARSPGSQAETGRQQPGSSFHLLLPIRPTDSGSVAADKPLSAGVSAGALPR